MLQHTTTILLLLVVLCSAIPSRHLKKAVDLNKKELEKKTANVELWGMQKFLRSTADEMNKMMKRSVQTGSSSCPQSPSEVQVALMPCLGSYLEVIPTVDMENIMNDPEVQRTYCEVMSTTQACVTQVISGCSSEELSSGTLAQAMSMVSGPHVDQYTAMFCPQELEIIDQPEQLVGGHLESPPCPTTPQQQMSTVYMCVMEYSEAMNSIAGQDMLSNPQTREQYCRASANNEQCMMQQLGGCSPQEIASAGLQMYLDQVSGSAYESNMQMLCGGHKK